MGRRPNFKNPKHRFGNKVLMSNCAKFWRFQLSVLEINSREGTKDTI